MAIMDRVRRRKLGAKGPGKTGTENRDCEKNPCRSILRDRRARPHCALTGTVYVAWRDALTYNFIVLLESLRNSGARSQ